MNFTEVVGMTLIKDQLFIYGSSKHSLTAPKFLMPSSSPSDLKTLSRGLIIGMSINGEFDFIYQIPSECESAASECDTPLTDVDGDGTIEAYYDETFVVDIKYHEASDSFYLLGNVNDYDATGILQSKYHGIIRFDENIQNTTFHHTFKNYLVSSGNFGAGARLV